MRSRTPEETLLHEGQHLIDLAGAQPATLEQRACLEQKAMTPEQAYAASVGLQPRAKYGDLVIEGEYDNKTAQDLWERLPEVVAKIREGEVLNAGCKQPDTETLLGRVGQTLHRAFKEGWKHSR